MDKEQAENLINRIINDPKGFWDRGHSYDLLQLYFNGLSLDTLVPLLQSEDIITQKIAIWIASELGEESCAILLDNVLPLTRSNERYIKYYAFECILLGTLKRGYQSFVRLVEGMYDDDEVIRLLAMQLLSTAEDVQLQEAYFYLTSLPDFEIHKQGFKVLLSANFVECDEIQKMINSRDSLTRKYGVIAAKKVYGKSPSVINYALKSSDPDVQQFAQEVVGVVNKIK